MKEGSQQTACFHERDGNGGQRSSWGKKPCRFAAPCAGGAGKQERRPSASDGPLHKDAIWNFLWFKKKIKNKKKKRELLGKKLFEVLVLWRWRPQHRQHRRYYSVPRSKRKLNTTLGLRSLIPPRCMLISKDCEKSSTAAEGTIYSNLLMCSRYYLLFLQIFCAVMAVWLLPVPVQSCTMLRHLHIQWWQNC